MTNGIITVKDAEQMITWWDGSLRNIIERDSMTYIERNLFNLLYNIAPIYGDNQIKEWLSEVGLNMTDSYRDDNYSECCSHPLLMHAVDWGDIELCKFFLRLGSDINAVDNEGNNALHWAIFRNSNIVEMIEFLLDEGIAVNHKNKYGHTPLSHLITSAAGIDEERKKEIADILIKNGTMSRRKPEHKNGI